MRIILLIILSLLGLECWIFYQYLNTNYDIFINSILLQYKSSFFIEKFPLLFTLEKFNNLKIIFPGVITLTFILFGLVYNYQKRIKTKIKCYLTYLISSLKNSITTLNYLSKTEKIVAILVFTVILLHKIILINRYPFSGDEAFSYFTFVENGLFITTTFYPEPNNHILYNLICIFFNQLLNNPMYVMRVPNLILYTILIYTTFTYILKYFNFTTAIIFVSIIGFSYSTSIYVVHGRGYELCSLLAVLSFIFTVKYNEYKSKNSLVNIIIFNCLGIFTIPIFIYITLGTTAYLTFYAITKKDKSLLINSLKIVGFTIIGTTILYLPTILVSGFDSIINNPYLKSHSDLSYYYKHIVPVASVEAIDYIIGTYSKGYIIISVFLLVFILLYSKVKSQIFQQFVLLFHFIIGCTFLTMISKNVFGEPRVFTMIAYHFYFIMSIFIGHFINQINNKFLKNITLVLIFVFSLSLTFTFDKKMDTFYGIDYIKTYSSLKKDIHTLTQNNKSITIYTDEKAFYLYLQFHNKLNNNNVVLFNKNNKLQNNNYDYIVTDFDSIQLNNYHKIKSFSNKIILKKIQ